MYLQEILEVAIGLVFLWLVLSISAMSIQEWFENVANGRAKDLEKAIRSMLFSDALARQLYNHPLIASLYQTSQNQKKKSRLPSYLPPKKFAAALFDIITTAGTQASPLAELSSKVDECLASSLDDPDQLKLALDDWQTVLETSQQIAMSGIGQAAVDTLKVKIQAFGRKYPEVQPTLDESMPQAYTFYRDFFDEERNSAPAGTGVDLGMRQFRLGLKLLGTTNARLKDTLTSLLRSAQVKAVEGEEAIARAQNQIESWFNDCMDRLSGAYKRKAQFAAFLIGLLLAVLLNIDSVNTAITLWREPVLRQAIVAEVNNYNLTNAPVVASTDVEGNVTAVQNPLESIPALQKQLEVLNFPLGWKTTDPVAYSSSVGCDLGSAAAYNDQGAATHLLGIHLGSVCVPIVNAIPVNVNYWSDWLAKFIGILISGLAAAQGAPFWFDILKKFINVRGTGAKPQETTQAAG